MAAIAHWARVKENRNENSLLYRQNHERWKNDGLPVAEEAAQQRIPGWGLVLGRRSFSGDGRNGRKNSGRRNCGGLKGKSR